MKLATQPGGSLSPSENVSNARYTPSVGTMRARGTSSAPSSIASPSRTSSGAAPNDERATGRASSSRRIASPSSSASSRQRVHESLAALGRDPVLAEPVLDRLLVVADLAQQLADRGGGLVVGCWVPHRAASCRKSPIWGRPRGSANAETKVMRRGGWVSAATGGLGALVAVHALSALFFGTAPAARRLEPDECRRVRRDRVDDPADVRRGRAADLAAARDRDGVLLVSASSSTPR